MQSLDSSNKDNAADTDTIQKVLLLKNLNGIKCFKTFKKGLNCDVLEQAFYENPSRHRETNPPLHHSAIANAGIYQ